MKQKSVKIRESTYNELIKVGIYGESRSDIIDRLLESYKKTKPQQKPKV